MEIFLKKIINQNWIGLNDKILVICGGTYDDSFLKKLNFKNYLITSAYKNLPGVKKYQQADAQNLPFKDHSFDVVIVNAGLHHCASPHKALTEMYRVAKKAVIVHEAQDSLAVRLLVKFKLAFEYETGAKAANGGGFNNSELPNFVYRWTKREVAKTLNSFDPSRNHEIIFFSSFQFYPFYLKKGEYLADKIIVKILGRKSVESIISFLVFWLNLFLKSQGNNFTFIIRKNKSLHHPWINSKKLKSLSNQSLLK